MMNEEQVKAVKIVYSRFIESEEEIWTDLDDNLELFDYLSDREMIIEAQIRMSVHSSGNFRCKQDHKQDYCLAPYILESVDAIVSLYKETGELHEKNRYIVSYYLVLSEMKMIFSG